MLIGPVFGREWVTAPRRAKFYNSRSAYVFALLVLISTAWQRLAGMQTVRNIGDLARFGAMVFQILAPLQIVVVVFLAGLSTASAVALEKDRKTLDLLLLTKLNDAELVLGKLFASILSVIVLIVAGIPAFMLLALLGGIDFSQIVEVEVVSIFAVLFAGTVGSTLALWREKTFQALSLTLLSLVALIGFWEGVSRGAFGTHWLGLDVKTWATAFSPWHALLDAVRPSVAAMRPTWFGVPPSLTYPFGSGLWILGLNVLAIGMLRVWNPPREIRTFTAALQEDSGHEPTAVSAVRSAVPSRLVWNNPVLWREIRTWAYGRRILFIRLTYLVLAGLAFWWLKVNLANGGELERVEVGLVVSLVAVLSLVLMNAQAVTAITSERDNKCLDLLLVTDLSPRELIQGKLGGILYNSKELILAPAVLFGYLWFAKAITFEHLLYLTGGWIVMTVFAATLGLHTGMNYANSRAAIIVSLGTVFFLSVGVAVGMRIMLAFSGSFNMQYVPFATMVAGGAVMLFFALAHRNPSSAMIMACVACPVGTFYAITSFLLGYTLTVFLVITGAYAFFTAAMLVPAFAEFDVATARTSGAAQED